MQEMDKKRKDNHVSKNQNIVMGGDVWYVDWVVREGISEVVTFDKADPVYLAIDVKLYSSSK